MENRAEAQALQEEIDYVAIKYAKKELKLTDESLLKGRMSDKVIEAINTAKLRHRTSKFFIVL